MRIRMAVLALAASLFDWAATAALAQGLPAARDVADVATMASYPGAITLQVDAADLDHKLLRVREALPVSAGPLRLQYPQWIPGNHAPTNEVKRLTGLRIEAAGKRLAWRRDPGHFHALLVDVPAGVSTLDITFQQVLLLEPTGSDALPGRQLSGVQWQGAVLYPAGPAVSRIAGDAAPA